MTVLRLSHLFEHLVVALQVMWSTFVPYIPPSVLPGTIFGSIALLLVILVRSLIVTTLAREIKR